MPSNCTLTHRLCVDKRWVAGSDHWFTCINSDFFLRSKYYLICLGIWLQPWKLFVQFQTYVGWFSEPCFVCNCVYQSVSLQACSDYPRVDITITQTDIMMTLLYHSRPQTLGFCKIRPTNPPSLALSRQLRGLQTSPLGVLLKELHIPRYDIHWPQG